MAPATVSNLDTVISSLVASVIGLVGIAFIVMLVFSGYSYISAAGNKEALARAQHSFMNAFIGLIVTLAAWIIVNMASNFLGLNLRNFSICITPGCT
jgi:ABC-type transport system involved in cytochrome bd biosynthesis fused ATPase/permease subunit